MLGNIKQCWKWMQFIHVMLQDGNQKHKGDLQKQVKWISTKSSYLWSDKQWSEETHSRLLDSVAKHEEHICDATLFLFLYRSFDLLPLRWNWKVLLLPWIPLDNTHFNEELPQFRIRITQLFNQNSPTELHHFHSATVGWFQIQGSSGKPIGTWLLLNRLNSSLLAVILLWPR